MGLERTEEAPVRWGADGDPKGNPPRGATLVWTPTKAGPFSSLDTRSSVAFNHDWLVDPRGDPVGRDMSASPPRYSFGTGPWKYSQASTVYGPRFAEGVTKARRS